MFEITYKLSFQGKLMRRKGGKSMTAITAQLVWSPWNKPPFFINNKRLVSDNHTSFNATFMISKSVC